MKSDLVLMPLQWSKCLRGWHESPGVASHCNISSCKSKNQAINGTVGLYFGILILPLNQVLKLNLLQWIYNSTLSLRLTYRHVKTSELGFSGKT